MVSCLLFLLHTGLAVGFKVGSIIRSMKTFSTIVSISTVLLLQRVGTKRNKTGKLSVFICGDVVSLHVDVNNYMAEK